MLRARDPWNMLRQTWWGEAGRNRFTELAEKPLLERFIQVDVLGDLEMLGNTGGSFLVRDEYRAFYNRLSNARGQMLWSERRGCLLLGQPGICEWTLRSFELC